MTMFVYFVDSMEYKDFMKYHFRCNAGVDIKSEIFMMDRSTADTPIKIMETPPIEYEYREYLLSVLYQEPRKFHS